MESVHVRLKVVDPPFISYLNSNDKRVPKLDPRIK